MRRKLIKQGTGGFTIYLPREWVRNNNLAPKDDVYLKEKGSTIVVSCDKQPEKSADLNFKTISKKLIASLVTSYYRLGYTELRLQFKERAPHGLIREILADLRGFTIVEEEEKQCVIRDISDVRTEEVEKLVNKFFQLINLTHDNVFDRAPAEEIAYCKQSAISYRDYCQRVIVMKKVAASYDYYTLALLMERIASAISAIPNTIEREHFVKHSGLLRELRGAYVKQDTEFVTNMYTEVEEELERLNHNDPVLQQHTYTVMKLIRSLCAKMMVVLSVN